MILNAGDGSPTASTRARRPTPAHRPAGSLYPGCTSTADLLTYGARIPSLASRAVRNASLPHHTSACGLARSASSRPASPTDLLLSMSYSG